ncbi:glycosyltransferase [Bacteriovoracales bacterium]|nr:glycosyltransferase [Bacteriovoracales bacterium]
MKSTNPFISVIIPTFNSENFIEETLLSVFKQTYQNFEVIVSDDGSSDQTIKKVKNLHTKFPQIKLTILQNKHSGPGENRNKGVAKSSGEWISFLDSDDLWKENKLQLTSEVIEKKQFDLVCHHEYMIDGNKKTLLDHKKKHLKNLHPFISLLRSNSLSPSATTLKKKTFLKVGGFDKNLPSAQDFDLWLRLAQLRDFKIYHMEKPLGEYIVREGSISSNPLKRLRCMLIIAQKYKEGIQEYSRSPLLETLRYKGLAYSVAGRQLLFRKQFFSGIRFFLMGQLLWPRFDWPIKVLKGLYRRYFMS